jgi:transposase
VKKIKIRLSETDRQVVESLRSKGEHRSREITRAHILAALDDDLPDAQIAAVLGVSRAVIWRTRFHFQNQGLASALQDAPRPGAPRRYDTQAEAEVVALACGPAPAGAKRWTIKLLVEAARERPGLAKVNRESLRQFLKKTS